MMLSDGFQISLSTAEEEGNYFTGEQTVSAGPEFENLFPAGTYRVVDSKLYMVLPGTPSELSD